LASAALVVGTACPGRTQQSRDGRLEIGDEAPDFTLKTLDGSAEAQLSSYRGEAPVALIFGSYT
jgi:hypothetical protein